MAYLSETATWEEGIRQLEVTDPVIGGPDGIDNIAPRQLANRTLFLKSRVDNLQNGLNQTNNNISGLSSSKEDKTVVSALAGRVSAVESGKEDKTTVTALIARIVELEKKSSVFSVGGGMVLWQKPANQIPAGWAEVVNWRGRLPMGYDPNDSSFNAVGIIGGSKTKTLTKSEIPSYTVAMPGQTGGDNNDHNNTTRFAGGDKNFNETSFNFTLNVNVGGDGNSFSLLNPYRVVMFIEYVG